MSELISIEGPVELHDDQLMLCIPLDCGGDLLAPYVHGIGTISDGNLIVIILPWLAEKLGIREGSLVTVDNYEGEFRIIPRDSKQD